MPLGPRHQRRPHAGRAGPGAGGSGDGGSGDGGSGDGGSGSPHFSTHSAIPALSQVLEASLGVVFPEHRQCFSRDRIFLYEQAELTDAETLPAADDHGSHAALVLSTVAAVTFNAFRFVPQAPRHVEALGPGASPVDMDGDSLLEAIGALQQQLDVHAQLAVTVGTDYRVHNAPLNVTMKQLLMKAYHVAPLPRPRAGPATTTDFTPACLERTRVLVVLSGLREGRAPAQAVLRALRGVSNMVVEDTADGSVQLWFVLRAATRVSEVEARAVDIGDTLRAFEALAAALGWRAQGGGDVGFAILDARQRGRFRLPLSRLRVHRWVYKYVKGDILKEKVRQLVREVASLPLLQLQPSAIAVGAAGPAGASELRQDDRVPCRRSPPGTHLHVNGEARGM